MPLFRNISKAYFSFHSFLVLSQVNTKQTSFNAKYYSRTQCKQGFMNPQNGLLYCFPLLREKERKELGELQRGLKMTCLVSSRLKDQSLRSPIFSRKTKESFRVSSKRQNEYNSGCI